MESVKFHQVFFGWMMKDYESFLRFAEAKVTQQPGFFPRQILAEKDFLSQSIGEAFDHRCEIVI